MNHAEIGRPEAGEYAEYYERYVSRVPEENLVAALESDRADMLSRLRSIPPGRSGHRYAPGKWSIREVVQHVVDTERVFGFRAFWFARRSGSPLPSFDQDEAMKSVPAAAVLADLISELDHLRKSHILFFQALEPEAWTHSGVASGNPFSVRALAAIIAGHSRHHAAILQERYL